MPWNSSSVFETIVFLGHENDDSREECIFPNELSNLEGVVPLLHGSHPICTNCLSVKCPIRDASRRVMKSMDVTLEIVIARNRGKCLSVTRPLLSLHKEKGA
jgi:hypothetical protein